MRWEHELLWQAQGKARRLNTGVMSLITSQFSAGRRKSAAVPSFARKQRSDSGTQVLMQEQQRRKI